SLYPVPAQNELILQGARNGGAAYRVLSAAGQLVKQGRMAGGRLDVSGLDAGFFVLEVQDEGAMLRLPFTKE
nr:T9SS type A sorting domain-containing protein [Flavobacteriales bacterium]